MIGVIDNPFKPKRRVTKGKNRAGLEIPRLSLDRTPFRSKFRWK